MKNSIKLKVKQFFCNHSYTELIRWHWVHMPEHDPHHIEVEWLCKDCGRAVYTHLYGVEAGGFELVMANHNKKAS